MNAASRYLAAQYERCIDAGLNLAEIRGALAARGIIRSAFQIEDDIERVFAFAGYATSHPAPAILTLEQIDRAIGY